MLLVHYTTREVWCFLVVWTPLQSSRPALQSFTHITHCIQLLQIVYIYNIYMYNLFFFVFNKEIKNKVFFF